MTTQINTDSQYLSRRFSLKELRFELKSAIANTHADCDDYGYWLWYQDTVKIAIDLKRKQQPMPKVKSGHIDVTVLKEKADIISIIESYGIELKKAGRNFKAICPFHTEKTPSFVANPDRQTWHCFGACNTGGDVLTFIQKIEGCDFKTAACKAGTL